MAKLLTYEKKDTWMDQLCGVTKLIYFLAWSITSMLTYDTRVLAVMLVFSLIDQLQYRICSGDCTALYSGCAG